MSSERSLVTTVNQYGEATYPVLYAPSGRGKVHLPAHEPHYLFPECGTIKGDCERVMVSERQLARRYDEGRMCRKCAGWGDHFGYIEWINELRAKGESHV